MTLYGPADLDVASAALSSLAGRWASCPRRWPAPWALGSRASRLASKTVQPSHDVFSKSSGDLVVDATDKSLGPALRAPAQGRQSAQRKPSEKAVLRREGSRPPSLEVSRLVGAGDVLLSSQVSQPPPARTTLGALRSSPRETESALLPTVSPEIPGTFVNLDMEDYKDLDLTIAVFTAILDQPDMTGYTRGRHRPAGHYLRFLGRPPAAQEWARNTSTRGSRIRCEL